MNINSVLLSFSSTVLLPLFAYILGIIIQCMSLLREKPQKWTILTFLGMLLFMSIMMVYSFSQYDGDYIEDHLIEAVIPQIMSFGFVFAFLFIAIFLKSVVININESVIVSNTISYWFLVFETRVYFSGITVIFLAVMGIVASIISYILILNRNKIRNLYKLILYGWYLFTNGIFAVGYFTSLPFDFYMLPAAVNNGEVSLLTMLIIGMIAVHILFNFGILYYSVIYSLILTEARKGLTEYSKTLFRDEQVDVKKVKIMIMLQVTTFLLFEFMLSHVSCQLIALWILLTPVLVKLFNQIAVRFQGGSIQ